ncbi:hypothetical protein HKD37_13G038162 [Glycine soja]
MKCFTPLQSRISCRVKLTSPSNDNNHCTTVHFFANSRPLKCGKSWWQPTLPIIREDHVVGVVDDHQNNVVDQKPNKKSLVAIFPPTIDYFM